MRKLQILDNEYNIEYVDSIVIDDERCYGICQHEDKEIIIDKNSTKDQRITTTLHEVFHAILERMKVFSDDEEEIVNALSVGLRTVMIQNNWNPNKEISNKR